MLQVWVVGLLYRLCCILKSNIESVLLMVLSGGYHTCSFVRGVYSCLSMKAALL